MKNKLKLPDPKKAKRFFSRKLAFTTGPVELGRWIKEGANVTVVDVRRTDDFAKGHLPGAVSLPVEKWHKSLPLKKDRVNVVYCYSQTCHLSARAALFLASEGFPVMELEGGFETWKAMRMPVKKGGAAKKAASRPARTSHRRAPEPAAEAAPVPALESEPQVLTQPA